MSILSYLEERRGNKISIAAKDSDSGKPFELEHEIILFSAALILIASSNVHATEALFFSGGGYTVEVLVGYLDDPIIAQVRFTSPEAKDSVTIPKKTYSH
jgi:hypothetical protein